MGVKRLQYSQQLEADLAKGKSLSAAHKSASAAADVGKKKVEKKNWVQKLKEKVGITLKKEKKRRARNEARFPKAKKETVRTKDVKGQLKKAGLTQKELDRFK